MYNIYDNEEFFEAYAKMPRSVQGLDAAGEWHQLQPLFPELDGKSVLDLGCGYGWHCKYAIEKGAKIAIGIDLSKKMIEEAQNRNGAPGISYEVSGIDNYSYPENTFDLVVSNLALHYISDLNTVFRSINKTLKKDGIFLFNIEHPIFTSGINQDWIYDSEGNPLHWPIDNYFYPGERITEFCGETVIKQHHTLTQIIMWLLQNNFELEIVDEAVPAPSMLSIPGMSNEMRRPMMLLVRAKKHNN